MFLLRMATYAAMRQQKAVPLKRALSFGRMYSDCRVDSERDSTGGMRNNRATTVGMTTAMVQMKRLTFVSLFTMAYSLRAQSCSTASSS